MKEPRKSPPSKSQSKPEEKLDEELEESFPASDPPVEHPDGRRRPRAVARRSRPKPDKPSAGLIGCRARFGASSRAI